MCLYMAVCASISDICKCCCRSGFIRFLLCSCRAYHKTSFIYLGPFFTLDTHPSVLRGAFPSLGGQQVCQTICMEFTICVDEVSPKSKSQSLRRRPRDLRELCEQVFMELNYFPSSFFISRLDFP